MYVAFLFFIQCINNTKNTINGLFNCFYDCFSCILILENIGIHMESRWNSSGIYVIVPGGFQSIIPYGMVEFIWNP